MGGSQNSKRVSWAFNLSQVRLFSSSQPPSKSLQPVQSGHGGPRDDGPPGFQRLQPVKLAKWRCPPRFEVNKQWQVAAGEESNEVKAQDLRETRVIEAVYPSPSTIPPNPRVFKDVEDSIADDLNTPVVRTTPIEDAAATAASSVTDQTLNVIDYDLLATFLSNSKLVQHLISRPSTALNVPSTTAGSAPSLQMIRPENKAPMAKDVSYCRSLIQQYGREERQDDVVPQSATNQFAKSRRRANCGYPLGQLRCNGVKRVKLN